MHTDAVDVPLVDEVTGVRLLVGAVTLCCHRDAAKLDIANERRLRVITVQQWSCYSEILCPKIQQL